ncbi:MAG: hypothetical protein HC905_10215 [Bacteroidales bacterium]|nr:hypothetical protein [Bacteroidales bacterium]
MRKNPIHLFSTFFIILFCFLDASEIDLANFHLVFLIQLTRFLGFFPKNDFSEQTCQFNVLQGSFVPETDTDVHTFSKRLSGKFHLLLELNYANASGLLLNRYERQELLELIMDFYRLHLHSNLNIQSLQVLKELFD